MQCALVSSCFICKNKERLKSGIDAMCTRVIMPHMRDRVSYVAIATLWVGFDLVRRVVMGNLDGCCVKGEK